MPALGAPTLKRIAHRALTKYIRSLHSIGDTPISLVRTIINKIDNPTQLRTLELNSPQTVGHTLEAWLNLLKRDIPNYEARLPENYRETIFAVENADKWHRVYKKLKRQVERETQEQNDRLRDTLRGVETKEPMRIAAKSTDPRAGNRQRKGWAEARYDLNKDLYHSGPGKASKGTSFFEKLNRNAVTKSSARMRTPTHKLGPVFNKEVKRAPMGLVEDLKERLKREGGAVPRGAGARGAGVAPPLHGPNAARANGGQPYDMIKDREARLRNLKTGGGTQASPEKTKPLSKQEIARLTEDFLEDDDDDMDEADNDDLFGGSTSKSKAPVRAHSPIARHGSPLKQAQRADTPPVLKKTRHPPTLFRPAVRK